MILTVAFSKGGCSKTTTATALINAAREHGKSTLAIDLDPQANMTAAMGGNPLLKNIGDVLQLQCGLSEAVQETEQGALVSAGLHLAEAEQAIQGKAGRDFFLKAALKPIKQQYDLIVIDTPPDINSLLVSNALAASDEVLLPMQTRSFAIMGLYQTAEKIKEVQQFCNEGLTIAGILYTQHNQSKALSKDLDATIKEQATKMGSKVFDTYIHTAEAIPQAQAMAQSIFKYAPKCKAAQDYMQLYDEMMIN